MGSPTTLKLVLSSEVRLIDLVHMSAETVAQLAGFDRDEALNIGLAVREGAINAIVHGNRSDPALAVRVTLSANGEGFCAKITDEGEGFDPESTPDPTRGAALLASSGRGLLLMRAFVDEVAYTRRRKGGMVLTIRKKKKDNPD